MKSIESNNSGVNPIERGNAVKEVIDFALRMVEQKYGTGAANGEMPKDYHNLPHTKGVLEAAGKLAEVAAENGKINKSDIDLACIAASFHDVEQGFGGGANERESVRLAHEAMKKTGAFDADDFEKVESMILSTIVTFENGVIKQSETEDYLTKIIADADLASLGQAPEKYWAISQGLLFEMKKTRVVSLQDQLVWAHGQVAFLSGHEFHTEEAKQLFPHKQENIALAKKKIEEIEEEIVEGN